MEYQVKKYTHTLVSILYVNFIQKNEKKNMMIVLLFDELFIELEQEALR
jgi:hypothetical protein